MVQTSLKYVKMYWMQGDLLYFREARLDLVHVEGNKEPMMDDPVALVEMYYLFFFEKIDQK